MVVLVFLAILWTAVIWSNSAKPAAESSGQSRYLLQVIEPVITELGLDLELTHKLLRKGAHMAEFALLSVLWTSAAGMTGSKDRVRTVGMPLAGCLVTALIDETIQLFYPGRSGQVTDIWVDMAGAALGVLFFLILRASVVRKRRRAS